VQHKPSTSIIICTINLTPKYCFFWPCDFERRILGFVVGTYSKDLFCVIVADHDIDSVGLSEFWCQNINRSINKHCAVEFKKKTLLCNAQRRLPFVGTVRVDGRGLFSARPISAECDWSAERANLWPARCWAVFVRVHFCPNVCTHQHVNMSIHKRCQFNCLFFHDIHFLIFCWH